MKTVPILGSQPLLKEATAEVIPIGYAAIGARCNKRYDQIISRFVTLFELLRDPDAPYYYEKRLEIVTGRDDNGQQTGRALVRTMQPKSSRFGVDYRHAQGFDVLKEQKDKPNEYTVFSLGHVGCADSAWMYSGSSWDKGRVDTVKTWLQENEPKSKTIVQELTQAALNPLLNPALALFGHRAEVIELPVADDTPTAA